MKTVKRKANVGERILITNKARIETRYENGNIGDVTKSNSAGIFAKINLESCGIFHNEYEVIIEEANEMGVIEQMQAEINELKSKVAALEGTKVGKLSDLSEGKGEIILPKSPQKIRDEIIAKAKRDVAGRYNGRGRISNKWGDYRDVEFIINKKKRSVAVLLRGYLSGRVYEKGIAKADPSDCFNVHLGKAIALRRALGIEVPAEYYNAPAPTEVRVGDVIHHVNTLGEGYTVRIKSIGEGIVQYTEGSWDGIHVLKQAKIIDDSREG